MEGIQFIESFNPSIEAILQFDFRFFVHFSLAL